MELSQEAQTYLDSTWFDINQIILDHRWLKMAIKEREMELDSINWMIDNNKLTMREVTTEIERVSQRLMSINI